MPWKYLEGYYGDIVLGADATKQGEPGRYFNLIGQSQLSDNEATPYR